MFYLKKIDKPVCKFNNISLGKQQPDVDKAVLTSRLIYMDKAVPYRHGVQRPKQSEMEWLLQPVKCHLRINRGS